MGTAGKKRGANKVQVDEIQLCKSQRFPHILPCFLCPPSEQREKASSRLALGVPVSRANLLLLLPHLDRTALPVVISIFPVCGSDFAGVSDCSRPHLHCPVMPVHKGNEITGSCNQQIGTSFPGEKAKRSDGSYLVCR